MKKIYFLFVALLVAIPLTAFAQTGGYTGQTTTGGYTGQATNSNSNVAQAKQAFDDTPIVLRGKIIKHLGGEYYIFKDSTGEITVEIEHDKWLGVAVAPNDTVEIYGEVERKFNGTKIDVDVIRKIN